jgi:hypothetical protein
MVIPPEKEKQDQHDNEGGRFKERDAEQALILQHVAPPPGRNCRHRASLRATTLRVDGVDSRVEALF